jgi:uncharacterized protein (TIGR02001 family)
MKTLIKAIAIASLASTAAVAQADVTGSVGVKSSYQFRGLELADGMTTHAGIGFDMAGLSVGVTMTDADNSTIGYENGAASDFTETDIVIGYSMNLMGSDVRLSYTDYSYDFGNGDDDGGQTEFSVGITASGLSIDYVDGEDTKVMTDSEGDFTVLSLGYNVGNVAITLGSFDTDGGPEYNYYEISTGTELFGLDATVSVTDTFSEENMDLINVDESGATLVVSVSKSLNL